MNIDQTIPPLRDLPTGRLDARKEHLLAEVQSSQKRPGAPSLRGWSTRVVASLPSRSHSACS